MSRCPGHEESGPAAPYDRGIYALRQRQGLVAWLDDDARRHVEVSELLHEFRHGHLPYLKSIDIYRYQWCDVRIMWSVRHRYPIAGFAPDVWGPRHAPGPSIGE